MAEYSDKGWTASDTKDAIGMGLQFFTNLLGGNKGGSSSPPVYVPPSGGYSGGIGGLSMTTILLILGAFLILKK